MVFSDLNKDGVIEVGSASSEILQENHYYPFGMGMDGPWREVVAAPENRLRYNGKELNSDFGLDWLDYGARWYDPSIGRWNAIDPLAEDYYPYSPYNYVLNNPIRNIDPDGRSVETDYYNKKGQHVKHVEDGSDAKVMVLTNSKKSKKVDAAIEAGQVGPVASEKVIESMDAAYAHIESTGKEAGFAVSTNGNVSSMAYGTEGEVSVTPKRAELIKDGKTVSYDVHTHPNDESKGEYGAPTPSGADMSGISSGTDPQNSVVLGYTAKEVESPGQGTVLGQKKTEIKVTKTIGFYNTNGSTGTMDYKQYKKAVKRIHDK